MKQSVVIMSVTLALALGGCSSARFGSVGGNTGSDRLDNSFGRPGVPAAPAPAPRRAPVGDDLVDGGRGLGAGSVMSTPLNAPGGSAPATTMPPAPISGDTQATPPLGSAPPVSAPAVSAPSVAAATPAAPQIARSNAATGTWKVSDAGASCRLVLTNQALFDLYRASPQGCSSPSLAKVNAWESRGNEIVLMEPGGKVAARLFPQANGQYSGATARGATLTMSR